MQNGQNFGNFCYDLYQNLAVKFQRFSKLNLSVCTNVSYLKGGRKPTHLTSVLRHPQKSRQRSTTRQKIRNKQTLSLNLVPKTLRLSPFSSRTDNVFKHGGFFSGDQTLQGREGEDV